MTEARIMTFGKKWWPHEDKRGWLPKIETVSFGFIFYFYERLVLTRAGPRWRRRDGITLRPRIRRIMLVVRIVN